MVAPISECAECFIQWTYRNPSENASELAPTSSYQVGGQTAEAATSCLPKVGVDQYESPTKVLGTCLFPALEESLHAGVEDARTWTRLSASKFDCPTRLVGRQLE